MTLKQGERIGFYEVKTPLGAGGMGEVYRTRDTSLNRDVAIKVLPDNFISDPERKARFAQEARILATLNAPHIASIFGLQEPAWKAIPTITPLAIVRLLHHCLTKDPKQHLQAIGEARIAVGESTAGDVIPAEAAPAPRRFSLVWMAAGAAVVLFTGILIDRLFAHYWQPAVPPSEKKTSSFLGR